MMRRGTKIDRGVAAFAAIIGILLQLFVFATHGPAGTHAWAAGAQDTQTLVICTSHGTMTIAVDAEGNPIDAPPPSSHPETCELCLGASAIAIAPPQENFVLAAAPREAAQRPATESIRETRHTGAHRNRGPPQSSIA